MRSSLGYKFEETRPDIFCDAGGCIAKFRFNSKNDNDVFKIIQRMIIWNQYLKKVNGPFIYSLFNVSHILFKKLQKHI